MNRREFISGVGTGFAAVMLAGCGFMVQDKLPQNSALLATTNNNNEVGKKMKIAVITGSPHKSGTSALLADKFIEGAKTAGHDVFRFDAAFEEVNPCIACEYCQANNSECRHKDAMDKLTGQLLAADVVAFVTPLYYFSMSAQIKTVIDRFHAINAKLRGNKKAILMATSATAHDWTMTGLTEQYKAVLRFLNWQDAGSILAVGCPVRSAIEKTNFPNQAHQFGLQV